MTAAMFPDHGPLPSSLAKGLPAGWKRTDYRWGAGGTWAPRLEGARLPRGLKKRIRGRLTIGGLTRRAYEPLIKALFEIPNPFEGALFPGWTPTGQRFAVPIVVTVPE